MMPGTWNDRIKKELPGGVVNKMAAQGHPYELKYLNGDSTVELVAFFLEDFYESREVIPPHRIYPFEVAQLQAIGQTRPTVREVLQWCRENCKIPSQPTLEGQETAPSEPETNLVELAFVSELNDEIASYLDNNHFLAEALFLGFKLIVGNTIKGVNIEVVTNKVGRKGGKDTYLNFKIIGNEDHQQVSIGVAVLQHDGGRALGAGLRRLLDENNDFNLTRGCLVRSKDKSINSYFQSNYVTPLVAKGGEFVELKENEIKPLIALLSVYRKREADYKVTEEQIIDFIENKGAKYWLGAHNPLLQEILSKPSYQVPADLKDEPESSATSNNSEDEDTEGLQELTNE